jgi:hypothetical protein
MTKVIPGFDGRYTISNDGVVMSYSKLGCKGGVLKNGRKLSRRLLSGYWCVRLWKDNREHVYSIHRLLAQAFIDGFSEELQVDHINRIKTDNRLCNLRLCTSSENNRNTKKHCRSRNRYKGVYKRTDRPTSKKQWEAKITVNGAFYNLGRYASEEEAVMAYNNAAVKLGGEYSYVNALDPPNEGDL